MRAKQLSHAVKWPVPGTRLRVSFRLDTECGFLHLLASGLKLRGLCITFLFRRLGSRTAGGSQGSSLEPEQTTRCVPPKV